MTKALWLVLFAIVLSGCAAQQAYTDSTNLFREGRTEAGMAKLEEAVRLDPGNAEYRIQLAVRRAEITQKTLAAAEQARADRSYADAEAAYRAVLRMAPDHPMAKDGLAVLALDAKHRQWVADAEALYTAGGVAQAPAVLDRLRAVLSADPRNKAALDLRDRVENDVTKQQRGESRLAAGFRKPITLQFNDAPLRAIFDAISRVSGLNFFFDKDVRPDARGTLLTPSTTVEDAVRLLLVTNQLEQKVLNENTILIYPNTPQKQKDYQTLVVRTFFLANADVKAISGAIKTIVKTRDLVTDERLGTIIMRDTPEAVRMAERIVAVHDVGDPEVMLEVEVLEVKRSLLQEMGIQWPASLTLTPLAPAAPRSDSALRNPLTTLSDLKNLNSNNIQAIMPSMVINFNQQDQNANILTNPRIRVRNKEKAKVLIGERIPVITSTTSGVSSFVSESVSYLDVGLKLEVEPQIYLDDEVAIKVALEVSNLVKEVLTKNGTLVYQIGTRGANTVLRLKDGETQVLAGLINDEDRATANRVPGLGQMPVLGRLFGSQRDDDQRSEILLSITPRVVRGLRRPALADAEFESGTESAIGTPSLRLTASAPVEVKPPTPAAALAMQQAVVPSTAPVLNGPGAAVPQRTAPTAGFASVSPPTLGDAPRVLWQGPSQVKAGQRVTMLVRGVNAGSWKDLSLQIGYDPQVLQFVEARPGSLFSPPDGSGSLLQPMAGVAGTMDLTLSRSAASVDTKPAGSANAQTSDVLVISFSVLPGNATTTALRLNRADPQPSGATRVTLPAEHVLHLQP